MEWSPSFRSLRSRPSGGYFAPGLLTPCHIFSGVFLCQGVLAFIDDISDDQYSHWNGQQLWKMTFGWLDGTAAFQIILWSLEILALHFWRLNSHYEIGVGGRLKWAHASKSLEIAIPLVVTTEWRNIGIMTLRHEVRMKTTFQLPSSLKNTTCCMSSFILNSSMISNSLYISWSTVVEKR